MAWATAILQGAALVFALAFLLPLAAHAAWWLSREQPASWSAADWSSAGLLPPAASAPEAMVRVYAARAGRWKGVFAHHMWLVLKEPGGARYERFDKVGWGRPVRRDGWAADARWYGNPPELVGALTGPDAAALIPRLRRAIEDYPHDRVGGYRLWPGPNSNSFIAQVLAAAPDFAPALPPTAIGKDWREGAYLGPPPGGLGLELSWAGVFGLTVGWVEGIELNLFGAVAGLDLRRPALKLPGFGRIGAAALSPDSSPARRPPP